ncbi:MAG: NTP transferase domain-containing protein, partial [Rickettsiales bacterium]|nr:NTP transferase domain-containing protein [Rickettsiales bacterium]
MSTHNLAVVILAAGKGTRMRSSLPKVMHKVGGVPMLGAVQETSAQLGARTMVVVIGPEMEHVRAYAQKQQPGCAVVVQETQQGTGDAVKYALPALEGFSGTVMVLYGDTPLLELETLKRLQDVLEADAKNAVAVLGFTPEDPAEYGRLVQDDTGALKAIVEYKDADAATRQIRFCNSGVMAFKGDLLPELLAALKNNNAKGEYYLTDCVEHAIAKGYRCQVAESPEDEVLGINSRDQLAEAEALLQKRLRLRAMQNGATLISPETTFLSRDTKLGRDVVIHPFVVIG